jgi:hypothetical protein
MTEKNKDTLRLNVTVEISSQTLQAIVAIAKKTVGQEANGSYRVDTADKVSEMVTKFLQEHNFDGFVAELNQTVGK